MGHEVVQREMFVTHARLREDLRCGRLDKVRCGAVDDLTLPGPHQVDVVKVHRRNEATEIVLEHVGALVRDGPVGLEDEADALPGRDALPGVAVRPC